MNYVTGGIFDANYSDQIIFLAYLNADKISRLCNDAGVRRRLFIYDITIRGRE